MIYPQTPNSINGRAEAGTQSAPLTLCLLPFPPKPLLFYKVSPATEQMLLVLPLI